MTAQLHLEQQLERLAGIVMGPALEELLEEAEAAHPDRPAEGLALLWRRLAQLRKVVAEAEDALQERLAPYLKDEGRLEVDGLGVFQHQPGTNRKEWDHDAVRAKVRAFAADPANRIDPTTGEATLTEADLLWEVVTSAARFEWRAGRWDGKTPGLRALGIDPDDYCTAEKGPERVRATWNADALKVREAPGPAAELGAA